jgi:hypothetical protein
MSNSIYFAPMKVPLVDPVTGIISREWYLLFQAIFNRIGGTSGQSTDDLLQGIPNELGAAELLSLQASDAQAAAQTPPMIPGTSFDDLLGELRQTRELVAELAKQLQGLQQGTVSL